MTGINHADVLYDYLIIGSGFGGAVCAMRLTEKGYNVLVLEKGKRFREQDFAKSNWQFWKYVWMPLARSFGILEISLLKGMMVLHGAGVGGGSLGYANALEIPNEETFATPPWNTPIHWGEVLMPYYRIAQKMLGTTRNPVLWKADEVLKQMAEETGQGSTFRAIDVGVFFGEEGKTVADPYFDGQGPERTGCPQCGACLVGCRYNSKNTLPKNYLYFAEKGGAKVQAEAEVVDMRPIENDPDGARYEVEYRSSTGFLSKPAQTVRAKNVIVAAGVMGSMALLLKLRDVKKSLPRLSQHLGNLVRTNSEALLGSTARQSDVNYSKGISITSIYNVTKTTRVEPVRYPDGSSLMRLLSGPAGGSAGRDCAPHARFGGLDRAPPAGFCQGFDFTGLGAQFDHSADHAEYRQPHAPAPGPQRVHLLAARPGGFAGAGLRGECPGGGLARAGAQICAAHQRGADGHDQREFAQPAHHGAHPGRRPDWGGRQPGGGGREVRSAQLPGAVHCGWLGGAG